MTNPEYNDYPLDECRAAAEALPEGAVVYQKFSCAGCGSRQTIETPNEFFTLGRCQECGVITDIRRSGCNYLVVFSKKKIT
jgi:hypothetical protein